MDSKYIDLIISDAEDLIRTGKCKLEVARDSLRDNEISKFNSEIQISSDSLKAALKILDIVQSSVKNNDGDKINDANNKYNTSNIHTN